MIKNHFFPESGFGLTFGLTALWAGMVLSVVEVLSGAVMLSIVEVLSSREVVVIAEALSSVAVLLISGVLSLVVLSIVTHQGKECQILTRDCFRTYNIFSGPDGSSHPRY